MVASRPFRWLLGAAFGATAVLVPAFSRPAQEVELRPELRDLAPLLGEVHAAADAYAARELLARLPAGAIVVLQDGTLLGHGWAQWQGRNEEQETILARERSLSHLTGEVEKHEAETQALRTQLEQARERAARSGASVGRGAAFRNVASSK